MGIADQILDHWLSHRTFLVGFENRTVLDVLRAMDAAEKRLLGEIAAAYEEILAVGRGAAVAIPHTGKGLKYKLRTLSRLQATMRDADRMMEKSILGAMQDVAREENRLLADSIRESMPGKRLPQQLQMQKVDAKRLGQIVSGRFGKDRVGSAAKILSDFEKMGASRNALVREALEQAVIDGASLSSTTSRVRKALKTSRHWAAGYVRTALQGAANDTAAELYRDNADVVKAEQYVATLDDDTCPICGPLDGKVYRLDGRGGKTPRPPRHANCRCFLAPVVKSWEEMGLTDPPKSLRSLLNGRRAQTVKWEEWVQRSPQRLDAVLGPTRAAAVRSGTLKLKDLATTTEVLTLEELGLRRRAAA